VIESFDLLGAPADRLPANLGTLVRSAAERFGSRSALHFEGFSELSFEDLATLAAGARDFLLHLGARTGDRILVALDNRPEYQVLWLGSADAGTLFVPMNPGYGAADAKHVIDSADPAIAVLAPSAYDQLSSLFPPTTILVTAGEARRGATPLRVGPSDWKSLGYQVQQGDYVTLGYTSGTTGLPKGCVADQWHWLLMAKMLAWGLELTEEDRLLTAQPCFYGDPQINLVAALWSGAHLTVLHRFRSQTFWDHVRRSKATKFWCIGTMPAMLMNTPARDTDDDHNLAAVWCLGIPRDLHKALEDRFRVRWLEAFGTSETGVNFFERMGGLPEVGQGWLGELAPYTDVRLVDDRGNEQTGDGEGYLEVRTPLLFRGYWDHEARSVREIPHDSWFATGDVLERVGGKFRFVRREKDIVRRSGENISCREVEQVLRSHPRIIDAAVVPRPDHLRGEEVWAFVLTDSPAEARDPSPDEIIAHASEQLARHKVPRFLTYVESFPMTPSERIEKHKLAGLVNPGHTFDRQERGWT